MAEPTLEELEKTNPNYARDWNKPDPDIPTPKPRNPLAMRRYTPAGPSATSYNPNSYNPSQSRPQSGVVRTGRDVNITQITGGGVTAGPVETFQRQPDGSITRDGVTVRPPRVSAPQNPSQTPRSTAGDFSAAAQQPSAQGQQSQVSRIAQVDRQAEQAAQAQEQKRQEAAKQANISVGEAFNEALAKYRDDTTAIVRNGRERVVEYDDKGRPLVPGVNGYEAKYQDSQNRYRIGALRPETIRALNLQRSALGLKNTDSIVGVYAVSGVDANGKPTGEPQIITRYRSADGRIHSKVYTYQEAARFVRGTMGDKGDADADDRFASMKQWQDADGNDALGITRTMEYQSRKAKRDAEDLKNQQTQQHIEQGRATFEQQQADRAKADRNRPVTEAKAEVDRLDKLAAAEKDEAAKQNWIDQANKARKVLADRQAEAMFADIKDATEEGASPANMPQFVKKNGKLVLKDGWMMKKQANGKSSIVPKPGWMLGENGELVKKPQKPGAKPSTPAATTKPQSSVKPRRPVAANPVRKNPPTIAEGSNAQRAAIKRAANGLLNLVGRNYIPD